MDNGWRKHMPHNPGNLPPGCTNADIERQANGEPFPDVTPPRKHHAVRLPWSVWIKSSDRPEPWCLMARFYLRVDADYFIQHLNRARAHVAALKLGQRILGTTVIPDKG